MFRSRGCIHDDLTMFKDLGKFAGLIKNLPKIGEEMDKLQQRLGEISAEGDAGAGMVRVKVNGKMEMLACTISDELMQLNDREMLEDLIRAATNQAMERVRKAVQEETGKMAQGFGLPAGM